MTPQYEKFTDDAHMVFVRANQEAQRCRHPYIGTGHVLLGLTDERVGLAATVLKNHGLSSEKVRSELRRLRKGNEEDYILMGKLPTTPRAIRVAEYANEESEKLGHDHVNSGHVLLGLLREKEGVAIEILVNLGVDLEKVRADVIRLLETAGGGV